MVLPAFRDGQKVLFNIGKASGEDEGDIFVSGIIIQYDNRGNYPSYLFQADEPHEKYLHNCGGRCPLHTGWYMTGRSYLKLLIAIEFEIEIPSNPEYKNLFI